MNKPLKYTLITVTILGGGFFIYKYFAAKSAAKTSGKTKQSIFDLGGSAVKSVVGTVKKIVTGFPLAVGTKNDNVQALQQAMIDAYGPSVLPKYGADGDFGSETLAALRSKFNVSSIADQSKYDEIMGALATLSSYSAVDDGSGTTTPPIVNNPPSYLGDPVLNSSFNTSVLGGANGNF